STIERGGIVVYPRLIAADHIENQKRSTLKSGLPQLDALLGGGLDSGTSTLFIGPAGSGKSTLAMRFAYSAASKGQGVAIYIFDETVDTYLNRARALQMDL